MTADWVPSVVKGMKKTQGKRRNRTCSETRPRMVNRAQDFCLGALATTPYVLFVWAMLNSIL
jgi:hypothetical protein